MQIKSIVSAAAIALVAGLGSASSAGQFAALEGITAEPLNAVELDRVRGTAVSLAGIDSVTASVSRLVGMNTAGIPVTVCPLAEC